MNNYQKDDGATRKMVTHYINQNHFPTRTLCGCDGDTETDASGNQCLSCKLVLAERLRKSGLDKVVLAKAASVSRMRIARTGQISK